MKVAMLSTLVGVSMLGLVDAANAAESMKLSDVQMDSVSAGQTQILPILSQTGFLGDQNGVGFNNTGLLAIPIASAGSATVTNN